MTDPEEKIDPQWLQARWVLGGFNAEELVNLAIEALEQGFDGNGLRQLAGLMKPTMRDLELLPERAFADMGLPPCDRDQAVAVLVAGGSRLTNQAIWTLVEAFPNFSARWGEHLAWWKGEPAGSYNDMSVFVYFVVEDLYEKGQLDEIRRAFQLLEKLWVEGDDETKNVIAVGFIERLLSHTWSRQGGNKVYEEFLGPMSREYWEELQRLQAASPPC